MNSTKKIKSEPTKGNQKHLFPPVIAQFSKSNILYLHMVVMHSNFKAFIVVVSPCIRLSITAKAAISEKSHYYSLH